MSEAWAVVIAAAITAAFGFLATLMTTLSKLRKENRDDHNTVRGKLENVQGMVESISDRLDGHIEWHLDKSDGRKED